MLQSSVLVPQYCQRNVTTRCNIARDIKFNGAFRLAYKPSFNISQAQAADFFLFSEAKGSERALCDGANY